MNPLIGRQKKCAHVYRIIERKTSHSGVNWRSRPQIEIYKVQDKHSEPWSNIGSRLNCNPLFLIRNKNKKKKNSYGCFPYDVLYMSFCVCCAHLSFVQIALYASLPRFLYSVVLMLRWWWWWGCLFVSYSRFLFISYFNKAFQVYLYRRKLPSNSVFLKATPR